MSSLQLNDMVEFQVSDNTYYGVLKWRGFFPKVADELAGIELVSVVFIYVVFGLYVKSPNFMIN